MKWMALAGLVCSWCVAGCGDGTDLDFDEEDSAGSGEIGDVSGVDLAVRDSLGIVDAFEHDGMKYATFRVGLTDGAGMCAHVRDHTMPARLVALALEVQKHSIAEQPPPIEAGRYDIGTSIADDGHLQEVAARFSATDDECLEQIEGSGLADEGTIVVDEIGSDRARGSFSLRFGADALNGSFDVALCPVELPFQATCVGPTF